MNKKKIIVIEDDASMRMLLTDLLGDKYQLTCVELGSEGLQLIEKNNYNLLILDIQLPDMLGTDLMRKIQNKKLTTIIITGYLATFIKDDMVLSHMDSLFVKPFKLNEFQLAVNNAIYKGSVS